MAPLRDGVPGSARCPVRYLTRPPAWPRFRAADVQAEVADPDILRRLHDRWTMTLVEHLVHN